MRPNGFLKVFPKVLPMLFQEALLKILRGPQGAPLPWQNAKKGWHPEFDNPHVRPYFSDHRRPGAALPEAARDAEIQNVPVVFLLWDEPCTRVPTVQGVVSRRRAKAPCQGLVHGFPNRFKGPGARSRGTRSENRERSGTDNHGGQSRRTITKRSNSGEHPR